MRSAFYTTLISCFLLAIGIQVNAQKHCDLSLTVYAPQQNQVIAFGDTAKLIINIKNNGPDDLLPTDTISYAAIGFPSVSENSDSIPAGDSANFIFLEQWADPGDVQNDTATWCLYLLQNPNSSFVDSNAANDSTCVTYILAGDSNTGINDIAANEQKPVLSPNPAKGSINIRFHALMSKSVRLSVIDLSGRRLMQKNYEGLPHNNAHIKLNLSNLNPDIYFIEIKAGNQKWTEKFSLY